MMDIRDILNKKNIPFTEMGAEILLHCAKNEDESPSCFLNLEKGKFHCWSCGAGGDINSFLRYYGLEILDELINKVELLSQGIDDMENGGRKEAEKEKVFNPGELWACESVLVPEVPSSFRKYLYGRGMTDKQIKKYSVLACDNPASKLNNYVIFPAMKDDRTLVGYVARSLDNIKKKKYINAHGFSRNNYLWPMNLYPKCTKVILVEGIFDVIAGEALLKHGITPMATLGAELSDGQINILLEMGVTDVILGFDNERMDKAGYKAKSRAIRMMTGEFVLWSIDYGQYKDMGEMSAREVEELVGTIKCIDDLVKISEELGVE